MWLVISGYAVGAVLLFFGTLTYFLCIRFLRSLRPAGTARIAGGRGFTCNTADGCRIKGEILVPEEPSGAAAVLADLPGGEGLAEALLAEGIAVIRFRGRGCKGSGRPGTWGVREARDLRLVYSTAANREPDACRIIGTAGRETGAAAALLHACMDDRVRFVIAVSPYADLQDLIRNHLRDKGFPPFPMLPLCGLFCRWSRGVAIGKASPAKEIRRRGGLMKVPVLLIAEQDNAKVPAGEVRRIAEALKGPVRAETVASADGMLRAGSTQFTEFRQWVLETIGESAAF